MKTLLDFLLYIRLQIGCFAVLIYIAISFFSVKRRKTYVHNLFSVIIISSICNLVFDMSTVYTVNHLETVPDFLNHLLHIFFVGSTALVIFCTYLYVRSLVYTTVKHPLGNPISWIPFGLSILCIAVLPIHYDIAPHTNYSAGFAVTAAYACIVFYFICCFFLLIKFRKIVDRKKRLGIVTALITILLVTSIQAFIAESLISSIGIVMLNLAFFFTVENPDAALIEELYYEKNKANEANKAKSTFLANMSHEIRTPINAMLGMDEMILREAKNPEIIQYAGNIKNAGTTLLEIVNEILDFSKIEAGKMNLIPENYDITSMIIELATVAHERADKKHLSFILNTDPYMPKNLYGDVLKIKQCILNLISNAIKYTKKGTVTFTIGFSRIDENFINVYISVKDTGIGIKKEDLPKLFSPFERIDEIKNRTIEGTGLGLALVEKTLALMNSHLEVESEYGKGSDFSFQIKQSVIDWMALGDIKEAYKDSLKNLTDYKEKLHAPDAKLLFVDDTEMNLEVIKGLLKNTEIQIDTVLSGKEALELVRKNTYDILFIDHRMPEMDGIETLHEMQKMNDNLCALKPCIALTANAISGVKKMYLSEGFTDYLSKPVNPAKLEEIIKMYLPKELIKPYSETENSQITEIKKDSIQNEEPQTEAFQNEDDFNFEDIDVSIGLENCGNKKLFRKALLMFYDSIEEKYNELENLFNSNDIKNYAIKIHALKSTARLIGASELSAQAAHLEKSANENDVDEVKAKHAQAMELFKSYRQKLSKIAKSTTNQKVDISESFFADQLKKIYEAADNFDITTLDQTVESLEKYKIPAKYDALYSQIKTYIKNVDFDGIKNLISSI